MSAYMTNLAICLATFGVTRCALILGLTAPCSAAYLMTAGVWP